MNRSKLINTIKKILYIWVFGTIIFFQNISKAMESADSRNAMSTETISLSAEPVTQNDTTIMFRLSFQNAEVLNFFPEDVVAMPACGNQLFIQDNKLCVDLSQAAPFKKGDLLGKIVVKWGDSESKASIIKDAGNGYYDGEKTNFQKGIFVEHNIIKNITVEQVNADKNISISVFFIGALIIETGVFLFLKNKKNTAKILAKV